MPDPKMAKQQKVDVARFPGNGELFTNSVFWCAHQERMIALSPSALDTARIEPIKPGMLNFWRFGVVLVACPCSPSPPASSSTRAGGRESEDPFPVET